MKLAASKHMVGIESPISSIVKAINNWTSGNLAIPFHFFDYWISLSRLFFLVSRSNNNKCQSVLKQNEHDQWNQSFLSASTSMRISRVKLVSIHLSRVDFLCTPYTFTTCLCFWKLSLFWTSYFRGLHHINDNTSQCNEQHLHYFYYLLCTWHIFLVPTKYHEHHANVGYNV